MLRAILPVVKGPLALLATLLLVSSGAAAASMRADLLIEGHVGFSDGLVMEGLPSALHTREVDGITGFHGTFASLTIVRVDQESFDVAGHRVMNPATQIDSPETTTLHDVVIEGVYDPAWDSGSTFLGVGFYPMAGSWLRVDLPPGAAINASQPRVYGAGGTNNMPNPNVYQVKVDEPHVTASQSGTFSYVGEGHVLVNGLSLDIQSREGTTRIATGEQASDSAGARRIDQVWVHMLFEEGNFTVHAEKPFDLAFKEANISWAGGASAYTEEGEVYVDDALVVNEGQLVSLRGEMGGNVTATIVASEPRLLMNVKGTTSPSLAANRAVPGVDGGSLLPIILLAVAAGAGGFAVWSIHAARSRSRLDPEEMLTLAHLAGEGGRHEEALGWIRRARAAAPESGALALEEAFHLGELGLVDEALAAYRVAARMLDDGQAEMDAALLGLASGALGVGEAESLLVAAVGKSPALMLELEDHPALRGLVAGPELSRAMRAARRRLGEP